MKHEIPVSVRQYIAALEADALYVCDNSEYVIVFDFDEDWDEYDQKTARFNWCGGHHDEIFSGNECAVPKIQDAPFFEVGIYAGNLETSSPARVKCKRSILSRSGLPHDPPPDVYAQLMALLDTMSEEEIAKVVESTLTQAKESGEFNGKDGYTPKKGVDYFDGKNGTDGKDGEPAVSPTVTTSKSGRVTTITITDENGTKTATINDGVDGRPGVPGYTPQKNVDYFDGKDGVTPDRGVDYFTPADVASIVQQVLDSIGSPWFGYMTNDKKIIFTGGDLTEGTYSASYLDDDGTEYYFGSITMADGPAYTNILDVYDIQYNKRFSPSSMGYKDGAGIIAFSIPWADVWNKTLRFKGFQSMASSASSWPQVYAISGSTYKGLAGVDGTSNMFTSTHMTKSGDVYSLPINATTMSGATASYDCLQIHLVLNSSGTSVSAADLDGRIITIDQEITV